MKNFAQVYDTDCRQFRYFRKDETGKLTKEISLDTVLSENPDYARGWKKAHNVDANDGWDVIPTKKRNVKRDGKLPHEKTDSELPKQVTPVNKPKLDVPIENYPHEQNLTSFTGRSDNRFLRSTKPVNSELKTNEVYQNVDTANINLKGSREKGLKVNRNREPDVQT